MRKVNELRSEKTDETAKVCCFDDEGKIFEFCL